MTAPRSARPPSRTRLRLEPLEDRHVPSSALGLTPLVQVSNSSPSLPAPPASPAVFPNSEVEPQLAGDPRPGHADHAVAVWQQDRYRSGGGARALFASVTDDASNPAGAHWSAPAAIPGFDGTAAGAAFSRYTDPWVSVGPDGTVYASALAIDITSGFPSHSAALVVRSADGGATWSAPTTLIVNQAPPGTDPIDLANDKEMVVADPTKPGYAYVVWDRLDHPSDQQNFNAFHGVPFREDVLFSRTTDGGLTWEPTRNLTNFKENVEAFGNQIVVEPNGDLVDVFTHGNGSGNQKPQADQFTVGVMRSTDHGATWSGVTTGPGMEVIGVTDPDTGAAVRDGEPLLDVAADPTSGNLYAVWPDGRFSGFAHDDIALSVSTNGGLSWSAPVRVNQTPATIPAGNQAAFTPSVAVNAAGTVAVTYYDFRNNTPAAGLPTDYWLAHADGNFTNPASWAADEKRLTNSSFNMENAAPTSRGYFLGDYQGLSAVGNSFYALFAQAGADSSDPSDIWFRDPPPAPGAAAAGGVFLSPEGGSPVGGVYVDAGAGGGAANAPPPSASPTGPAAAGAAAAPAAPGAIFLLPPVAAPVAFDDLAP